MRRSPFSTAALTASAGSSPRAAAADASRATTRQIRFTGVNPLRRAASSGVVGIPEPERAERPLHLPDHLVAVARVHLTEREDGPGGGRPEVVSAPHRAECNRTSTL